MQADFRALRDAYDAVGSRPAHFDQFAVRTSHGARVRGWTEELRSLHDAQAITRTGPGDGRLRPIPHNNAAVAAQ